MKAFMNNIPSPLTRVASAIDKLPAALAAQPRPGDEAAAITGGNEQRVANQPGPPPARWDAMTDQLDIGREPAANEPAACGEEVATLVKSRALYRNVVAQRFVLARELNGLSQTEGAHAIGYAKSGQLSLIESGRKSPPLGVLVKASEAYRVSADFLLGVCDCEERDPQMARRAAMRQFVDAAVRGIADVLADTGESLIEAQITDVGPLSAAASRVVEAFARVASRPEFSEVRSGATLAREVRELEVALAPVLKGLRRHAALDAELRQRISRAKLGVAAKNSPSQPTSAA